MQLRNAVVLVTGANRGIGLAFAEAALIRGAGKVYAAARNPSSVTLQGVVPVRLDVTSADEVSAAARLCADTTVVVNNAGIAQPGGLLGPNAIEAARLHFETNVLGMLRVMQCFAPVPAANGGGAFLNVLSAASWVNSGAINAYAVSKAAAWSLTNGSPQSVVDKALDALEAGAGEVLADERSRQVHRGLNGDPPVYL